VTHCMNCHDMLSKHHSIIHIEISKKPLPLHCQAAGDDTITYMPVFQLFPTKISSRKNPPESQPKQWVSNAVQKTATCYVSYYMHIHHTGN